MSLNTRVHIVSRSGKKETITARELLARGTGTAFETFQMLDEYEALAKAYDAEQRAISDKKDREDHLPLGAHLLPEDYQEFLYIWNKTISQNQGWWNGEDRANFWKANPEHKAQFTREHKWFTQRYPEEVKAVKAYQATHSVEDSDDEEQQAAAPVMEQDELESIKFDHLPSLPPSPVAEAPAIPQSRENLEMPFQQDLCSSCNWNNILGHATSYICEHMPPSEPQDIPQILPAQGLTEQPDTDGEDDDDAQPKKPHNPIYTSRRWPSPIAKVFVQHIRGNNAWNNGRNIWWRSDGAWAPDFKVQWRSAGNSEFKLTHDNCMRYLAYRMGRITLSKLLEMDPNDVHAKLIGQHHGVPGFFTKRYSYY
jgi:hypothetical protein